MVEFCVYHSPAQLLYCNMRRIKLGLIKEKDGNSANQGRKPIQTQNLLQTVMIETFREINVKKSSQHVNVISW